MPLDYFWAVLWLAMFLLLGQVIQARVGLMQRLFIPGSIIAGVLVLALGAQGLGRLMPETLPGAGAGLFPDRLVAIWRGLPGLLISVVFAALFLGHRIPGPREIWIKAGSQIAFGQTLAWGQYVVGITLAMLVLTPVFGMPPVAGALIEIAFEGGHGTAAGMAGTFHDLGFPEGADLALGLATVGLVSGVLIGTVLINWAVRRNHIVIDAGETSDGATDNDPHAAMAAREERRWEATQEEQATDPLSIHLGVVGVAIAIGWLIRRGLLEVEARTWGADGGITLIAYVPLFPLAMIGGVLVQLWLDRTGRQRQISRRLMNRISGTALDFTIVAALGTLSLTALGRHWAPFLLLAAGGIAWNVFGVLFLAPRMIPFNWFQRGVGDFGQSMGVTVTGLLLMRMADPKNKSGALESFGYKQLLFEPIVGGGLFTAAAMPLIAQFGPGPVLILTAAVTLAWLIFGWRYFGRLRSQ